MKLYNKSISIFLVTIFLSINTSQRQNVSPIISTIPEAIIALRKIMINAQAGSDIPLQEYEKKYSGTIVVCAKILYDAAYEQILDTLQEIDGRLKYWQYQKNHPWRYFVTKNPVKWVTGATQNEEINNNIEQLESHQGELYVLLGQLAEYGNAYDHKHKTLFKNEYIQAYAWVDGLLDLLVRIKVSANIDELSPFIARVTLLKAKLERVRFFKNQILSEMKETVIPAHLERNWLKYGVGAAMLGLGYNRVGQIGDFVAGSYDWTKDFMFKTVQDVNQFFFPPKLINTNVTGLIVQPGNIGAARSAMISFLDRMEKDGIITAIEKSNIIADEASGSSASFQDFFNKKIVPSKLNVFRYGFDAASILLQLISLHGGRNAEQAIYTLLSEVEEQVSGVRRIGFIAPVVALGAMMSSLGYFGYKKITAKDYASIRRALVDINSLFVDATKPLDDESYGKMLYLIYDLKKRAVKDVPLQEQPDFMNDLNRVESKEFNVRAKRAIVDDMFRKYSFLRLS